ncbi:uncharacterized protein LOC143861422 [Tasmannia lanceolata]|uniref:uncharacterized protein LOC143861422 n=1 Tax=Tasmannia lanceolata TaxID=3420 RepID=UPI004063C49C
MVKNQVKDWNREVFGRIDIQVPIIRKSLLKIQASIEKEPASHHLIEQEAQIRDDLLKYTSLEESFLKQKSRAQWLQLGDSNSKFFYSHLKTAAVPDPIRTLNVGEADFLTTPITSEEIKDVVWKSNGDKSSGPDGFNASFYRSFWYLLGDEFIAAIKNFFKSGKLLKSVNATFLSLIPKGPDTFSPSHYRPISLYNFLYKTITKILANRLRSVISNLICPSQSAFIRGRQIQDNILLTHDLLHRFHLPSPSPAMCLKINLAKAFDNVNRQALLSFMAKQGFNSTWLGWIEECILHSSFSILVNGSPQGYFNFSNGLRQGDPLSPLLFSISMEMLSVLLDNAYSSNTLSTPFSQDTLAITHLLFADDLMLFAMGTASNATILSSCLTMFHRISGMEANHSKSEIYFRGTTLRDKLDILQILGFNEGSLPIRYLGLPLFTSRLTVSDCAPLITKVRTRIVSWASKSLSQASRIELVKTVLNSFMIYWSSAFDIPKGVIDSIESIFRTFIWGSSEGKKSHHSISWNAMCRPKSEGGIAAFKAFMGIRSIIKSRDLAKPHICCLVGNEAAIDLWSEPWHPRGVISSIISKHRTDSSLSSLKTLEQLHHEGSWNPILNLGSLTQEKSLLMEAIFSDSTTNTPIWKPNSNGIFSTKSGWEVTRPHFEKPVWASRIWFSGHIPRHALVTWKALSNGLSTTDNLPFLDPTISRNCILCNSGPESVNHLFFQCSYSNWVWKSILRNLQLWRNPEPDLIQEELWLANHFKGAGQTSKLAFIALEATIYNIWSERNHRFFRNTFVPKSVLLSGTLSLIRTKILGLHLEDVDTPTNRSIAANFGCAFCPKIRSPQVCCWSKPNQGSFKINSDASLSTDGGGMGGAIRNHNGFLVSMFSVNVESKEILVLEIKAVLVGLQLAASLGLTNIWIEVDSKIAADVINGTSKTPWKCFACTALPPFLAAPALLLLMDSDRIGSEYYRLYFYMFRYLVLWALCCWELDPFKLAFQPP